MPLPATIPEVLAELDRIIAETIADDNYLGVFAYVYRRTTAQILTGINAGNFEDNTRMRKLDVRFANLYIRAYRDFHHGKAVSRAWSVAFEARHRRLALLQHLLLGMNAHINLDLAIAASAVMEGAPSFSPLKGDFDMVNDILASITDEMQERLSRVSPLLFLLDLIGQRGDEKLADFSIKAARTYSWNVAQRMWGSQGDARDAHIGQVDVHVARLAERLRDPRFRLLRWTLDLIKRFETDDKAGIIRKLRET